MAIRTIRVWWGASDTGWRNFNHAWITSQSVVHISACEWRPGGTIAGNNHKHRGPAPIYVKNIRPHGNSVEAGGVEFYVQVGEGGHLGFGPLPVVFDITIFDNPDQQFTV